MKQIYLKFSMLLVCLIAGLSSAFATESPWSVTSFSGTIANNSITINGATWTLKDLTVGSNVNGEPAMSISSKKLKFGNGKNQFWSSYTLYTDYFEDYNVTKVIVSCYDNGGTTSSVTAKQGTVEIGTATVSSTSSAEYTLNTKKGQGGELDIIYNSTTQASYITAITVYYEGKNTEPFTVTFDANANGTCNTTSLTESAANAGVTLPSCTANTGYDFVGWATTATATTADAGKADDTYYPTAATTLYAVYKEKAVTSTVTYNFNDKDAYPDNFPTAKGTTMTAPTTFTISGNSITIYSPNDYYIINNGTDASRGLFFGKSLATNSVPKDGTAYLEFPAKEGWRLTQVVATTTAGMGSKVKLNVYDSSWKAMSTQLTTPDEVTQKDSYTFDLETSEVNTAYRLTAATSSKNMQYDNIVLTYEKVAIPDPATITISTACYATYYNSKWSYTMPEDCEGYVFTETNGLEAAYEGGDVVPASEPLVIYTIEPGDKTLEFTTSTEDTWKSEGMNDLDGTDEETALAADADSYFYALSLNAEGDANSVGFYWMNDTGAAFTNGAHKAYLKLAKSAGSKSAYLFNDEATAINAISTEATVNAPAYNLAGQRVNANAKGIVIMNGHKYINK